MAKVKFKLAPGQQSPEGSTGQTIPGTNWIVWDGTGDFPAPEIEHEAMTAAEQEACTPAARKRAEALQIASEAGGLAVLVKAGTEVLVKRMRKLKKGENWPDETFEELVAEAVALIQNGDAD